MSYVLIVLSMLYILIKWLSLIGMKRNIIPQPELDQKFLIMLNDKVTEAEADNAE